LKDKCPICFGTGVIEPIPPYIEDPETCLTCNGTGEVGEDSA